MRRDKNWGLDLNDLAPRPWLATYQATSSEMDPGVVVTLCFTPSQPLWLYQGEDPGEKGENLVIRP